MRAIIVLALCLTAGAAAPTNPQRIMGGSVATIIQHPSIAALQFTRDLITFHHACGGTIINTRSVLTATHCLIGSSPMMWRVRVGSTFANSGGVIHSVGFFIFHPNFNIRTLDNDISIIRTISFFSYNNYVQPSFIAGRNFTISENRTIWAAGWGHTSPGGQSSEQLQRVELQAINQNTCRRRYGSIGKIVTDSMLCAGWLDGGGRGQCQGDSGGPLYRGAVLVGVYSWGLSCGLTNYPSVNTRVSCYNDWIMNNV